MELMQKNWSWIAMSTSHWHSIDEAVRLLRTLKLQVLIPIQLTHLEIAAVTAEHLQRLLITVLFHFIADPV